MNLIKFYKTFPRFKLIISRNTSQAAFLEENEYSDTPKYPTILDMSLGGRKRRDRENLYEKIKQIHTVEEKQIALNMPRYYGWQSIIMNEDKVPYNAMPLVQYYTRTYFKPIDNLPDIYTESSSAAELIVQEIKEHIEQCIVIENEGIEFDFVPSLEKPEEQQHINVKAQKIIKQINRIICNNLSDKTTHLISSQVDYNPRHEAFWFIGGVDPPPNVVNWRNRFQWLRDRSQDPIDRPVQYKGSPFLTIRHSHPLKPILPYSEAEDPNFIVPKFTYLPENVGYYSDYLHGTNIPGFWPGDHDEYGLLSYHGSGHIVNRKESFTTEDNIEALHCQGIKASFGWLLAQANYQGFTTYNDITYPLVTQTVVSDGQQFSFYIYQLNTIEMHNDKFDNNPKHNICFGTKPMKLYETIENGTVKGLNTDVLKILVQLYLNTPEKRSHEMKPFLGKEEQVVADIEDDKKRCWLESTYKHLVSNRPRHNLLPEIYLWEKIYKIKHNTRFFEAKRRPFEFGENPFKRRLDEHLPPYIPKVLRPYPRSRKKFETTYYPKV